MLTEHKLKGRKLLIANHFADTNNRAETIDFLCKEHGLKFNAAKVAVSNALSSPDVVAYLQTRLNVPVTSVTFNAIPEPKPLAPLPSTHQICLELYEKWQSDGWEPCDRLNAIEKYLKVTGGYAQHNAQTQTNQLTQINVNIKENGS